MIGMAGAALLAGSALILAACGTSQNQNISDPQQICGGYTEQREPTNDEIEMFRSVTASEEASYTPLSVSTQVVAGTNYRFWCRYQDAKGSGHCWITIFKPLPGQGEPSITSIEKLK
mgnify:CR=1 FL=1